MKRVVVFVITMVISLSASAQIDIKAFDMVGKEAIEHLLGNPFESWDGDTYPGGMVLGTCEYDENGMKEFGPCGAVIGIQEEDNGLFMFSTASPAFLFLTNMVEGGIKVGDSIGKIQKVDFIHSKYGRNKPGNGLQLVVSSKGIDQYCLLGEEMENIYLRFKNGILIDILYTIAQDVPYENYDFSNRLLSSLTQD